MRPSRRSPESSLLRMTNPVEDEPRKAYPAARSTAISVARVRPSATPSQRVWTQ
jgi:hypothetical protein